MIPTTKAMIMTRQIDLFEEHRNKIRSAFINAVFEVRNTVNIKQLEDMIKQGRVEAAIQTLNIDERLINDVVDEVKLAYQVQGANLVKEVKIPEDIKEARWEKLRAPLPQQIAEQWARDESSKLIVEVVNPQRQLARSVIEQGLINRVHPRQVALQIVGKWNNKLKRREFGFIGLTNNQQRWVDNVARELASGSKEDLRRYLSRKLRDKRFDRTVTKAIREGTPIPADKIQAMTDHYKGRALKYRGNNIGRTESLRGMNYGRQSALENWVETGGVKDRDNIQREWRTAQDSRVRDDHRDIFGQRRGLNEPFDVGGFAGMQPGDENLPAAQSINCRCWVMEVIDWEAERDLGLE